MMRMTDPLTAVGLPVSRLAALLLEGGWMRPVD